MAEAQGTQNQSQRDSSTVKDVHSLNENFCYNSMLGRALLQILPHKDRKSVKVWFDKLAEMDDTDEQLILRHEYMWFLLLMLQTKKIREPFSELPPKIMAPLKDAVPMHVYEEVLISNDQSSFCMDTEVEDAEPGPSPKTSSPSKFLDSQPLPKNGIVCYLAAFSDQDIY